MKKIFTLLALAFVAQATFADDVIASYTFPDQTLSATTSTVAGTNCTVSYAKIGGSGNDKSLDGKFYHKITNATSGWIKITLTSGSFQGGDKFYATLNSGSASTDGFKFKTSSANSVTITYNKDAESTLEYTLKDDDINDDGSLTIYRHSSNCYVRHIEVTRAAGATKETPTTEFASDIVGFKLSEGAATSQAVSTNSDGAVTYESNNTSVVSVDASTGALTANAIGKAKITAKTASSSTYAASSASYIVYVLSNGDGTLENPYLPTDYRFLSETYVPQYEEGDDGPVETSVKAWVAGYIVGVYNSGDGDVRILASGSTTTTQGTIGLGNTASETVGNNCLTVQLISETKVREDLNLKDNGDKLGTKVWIYGRIGSFSTSNGPIIGLRHADYYSWDGVTIVPEATGVNNISAVEAQAEGKIFNLSGMEVKTPTKGIYIQNGKKIAIK